MFRESRLLSFTVQTQSCTKIDLMERFIFSCVAIALMLLGVHMAIWPAWIILADRETGDSPPTSGEVWRMRLLGIILAALAGYGLYALVTRMPGAEFFPC